MKIFSSFDTKLKGKYISEYQDEYGEKDILVISRSKLYFYNKVLLRIVYGFCLHLFFIISIYYLLGKEAMINYGIRLGLIFGLIFYFVALENYIDYTMNYAIFTPDEAILVEQIGIFNRNIKSLDIKKIKSISTKKSNLFFSIFNDGIITILSDSNENLGEIKFKYVHQPEHTKEKIHNIIMQSPKRLEYHNTQSL